MKIKNRFRNVIAYLINTISSVKKLSRDEIKHKWEKGEIRKIIIIRQNQGIGDMLLFTPVIKSIKKDNPSVIIDVIASPHNYVAIKTNPHLNEIYIFKKSAIFKNLYMLIKLRKKGYDLAIVVSSHTPSFTSFLYARLISPEIIIGYETRNFYQQANWSRYLSNFELPVMDNNVNEVEKFLNLISPLGISFVYEPEFYIPVDIEKEMYKKYVEYAKPAVGIFLGGNSTRSDRMWSEKNWALLYNELEKRSIKTIAIVPPSDIKAGGGAKEKILYNDVCRILNKEIPFFSSRDFVRLGGFLKNLSIFICPDGGIFHLSVAIKLNTIGIFIKTDPGRWALKLPWVWSVKSYNDMPDGVSVRDVMEKVEKIIKKSIIN